MDWICFGLGLVSQPNIKFSYLGCMFKAIECLVQLSLTTMLGSSWTSKPSRTSTKISLVICLLRKAVMTSICLTLHFLFATKARMASIAKLHSMEGKIFEIIMPSICWKPLTHNLALNFEIFHFGPFSL